MYSKCNFEINIVQPFKIRHDIQILLLKIRFQIKKYSNNKTKI